MDKKIAMFLRERDRARARGDTGIDRALSADLQRWGVPYNATLANPSGKNGKRHRTQQDTPETLKRKAGRPPKPRCEHDQIADRCEQCRQAEIAEARGAVA